MAVFPFEKSRNYLSLNGTKGLLHNWSPYYIEGVVFGSAQNKCNLLNMIDDIIRSGDNYSYG